MHGRGVVRMAVTLAIGFAAAGCTATMTHPDLVVPVLPLKPAAPGPAVERVGVVSIASVGTNRKPAGIQPQASRRAAEWLDSLVIDRLTRRGIRVSRPAGPQVAGRFEAAAGFHEEGVNMYGPGYHGRLTIPSYWCVDDSALGDPASRAAFAEVLDRLGTIRKDGGERPIAGTAELRRAFGADALILSVMTVQNRPAGRKVAEVAATGLLSLGFMPAYEPSSCLLHLYCIDLTRGVVRWADGCRINRADGAAAGEAWDQLSARWP